jgi:hypothetical protein
MAAPQALGRGGVKHGHDHDETQGRQRRHQPDEHRDEGGGDPGQGPEPLGPEEGGGDAGAQQPGMPLQVDENDQPAHGHGRADHGVEQEGADLVAPGALRPHRESQFRRREREDRGRQQQPQVAPQEAAVDAGDPGEQGVVIDPHHADVHERRHVGQVGGPLVQQVGPDMAGAAGRVQVEHQERDGDGQDAVAERLDPVTLG